MLKKHFPSNVTKHKLQICKSETYNSVLFSFHLTVRQFCDVCPIIKFQEAMLKIMMVT